jgi:NAD(P)-dependent dehydrogenase (short-subunit alcohol dehydrogenase family)
MQEFSGKVAVVTGGASGIGRALVERFAREGMKVVVADVEKTALDTAVAEIREGGAEAIGVQTDVRSLESVQALAGETIDAYGAVHVVFNNAGVGTNEMADTIWTSPDSDWRWCFQVNVWGVLNGIKAFVPLMIERGEDGHVINTSSGNGGLYPLPTTPIYSTTKAAVTTISEVLNYQLQMQGAKIKAGVLFPGPHIVNTGIFNAARNRPEDTPYDKDPVPPPSLDDMEEMYTAAGMEWAVTQPAEVAEYTLEAIKNDQFWILPESPNTDTAVKARLEGIISRTNPSLG